MAEKSSDTTASTVKGHNGPPLSRANSDKRHERPKRSYQDHYYTSGSSGSEYVQRVPSMDSRHKSSSRAPSPSPVNRHLPIRKTVEEPGSVSKPPSPSTIKRDLPIYEKAKQHLGVAPGSIGPSPRSRWSDVGGGNLHLGDQAVKAALGSGPLKIAPLPTIDISMANEAAATQTEPAYDRTVATDSRSGSFVLAPNPTNVPSSRPSLSDTSQRVSSTSGVLGDKLYRYTPLGEREFRLVRILAPRKSQVKCEILVRSLDDPPPYTAVSYAWGDPVDSTKVKIRDENYPAFVEVPIAKSLCYALQALRKKGKPVVVWADALSIDQQNREERNQQLPLMTDIYKRAESVAICLGPEEDDSELATGLLQDLATADEAKPGAASRKDVRDILARESQGRGLPALAALFEREYWKRLWIVQEQFNAADINVYCGSSQPLPWKVYQAASHAFQQHKHDLENLLPKRHNIVAQKRYSYSQILAYQGPGSLPDRGYLTDLAGQGDDGLLEIMRICRRKLSSDPKDKVFGVLGILNEDVRDEFTVDYGSSVKDIYTDVVDYLLTTSERLDVICESIQFPTYSSSNKLPTWVPDWSHVPDISAMSLSPGTSFAASGDTSAVYKFLDDRRNKLEISGISLGVVSWHGIPVGTLCTVADYLMAFLNWRALLLGDTDLEADDGRIKSLQSDFCDTLCFRQIPAEWKDRSRRAWVKLTYHVFASLLQARLPYLTLDKELAEFVQADAAGLTQGALDAKTFLQMHFSSRMMGRCLFKTSEGRLGLGTGFMAPEDEVVVPLGCSTPILLRKEGNRGEYRFVGDVYVDGYMHGKAVKDRDDGRRHVERYVLH